jgi:copper chaperone CopZ
VTLQTDTIQVTGVRCERCLGRLAVALRGHEGIEAANANLIGEVTLSWDSDRTSREAIVATLSRAGFYEAASPGLGNTTAPAVVRS